MSRKTTAFIIIAAIIVSTLIFLIPEKKDIPENSPVPAATADQRTEYFAIHGWEVEEIAEKKITIPEDFSGSYGEYALMQDKQGLPLREYAGKNAELYIYSVKNYSPESRKMLAELIVCDNTAVASMVYSDDRGSLRLAVS